MTVTHQNLTRNPSLEEARELFDVLIADQAIFVAYRIVPR